MSKNSVQLEHPDLDRLPIGQLEVRRMVAVMILNRLRGAWSDDPRAAKALKVYRAQLKTLDRALNRKRKQARLESGEPEPPAQVIGMKTLHMTGRARR